MLSGDAQRVSRPTTEGTADTSEDASLFDEAVMATPQRGLSGNLKNLPLELKKAHRIIDTLESETRARDIEIEGLKAIIRKQAEELDQQNIEAAGVGPKGKSRGYTVKVTPVHGAVANFPKFAEFLSKALDVEEDLSLVKSIDLERAKTFIITRAEADGLVRLILDVDEFLSDRVPVGM